MVGTKRIPLFIICLFFFACKKDTTVDYPAIQIISPAGLVTYNVFDTIQVTAHVSDAGSTLQSINVFLSNPSSAPVLQTVPVKVTSNNMTFTISYVLGDIHLAGGNYNVTVTASNGTNVKYAYEEIYVKAAPIKRVAVYAIVRSGTNLQISKLDSVLHVSSSFNEWGNFAASDVSSYYQQLYISALDTGNMNAVAVPGDVGAWGITGVSSVAPYFTNVYSYGDAAYVSFYNGNINYYNHSGIIQNKYTTTGGYYPIKTLVWSNYLFAEDKDISSPAENLVLYYIAGLGYQQTILSGPLVAMYGQDNNDILVFGNTPAGNPYLEQYNIRTNLFYSPVTLPSAKLLSVAQIDNNTYLIGFANNTIYYYTFNPINLVSFIPGVNATSIRYDVANNVVVVGTGSSVNEYSYTTGSLLYSTPLSGNVLDVQILYNK